MNPALVDVLDWVEELREDLRANVIGRRAGFDWAQCGTPAQYRKHLRYEIPLCHACRQAEARRFADRWRNGDLAEKQRVRRQEARQLERDFAQMVRTVNVKLNGMS